jgi:hypothetical protein
MNRREYGHPVEWMMLQWRRWSFRARPSRQGSRDRAAEGKDH